MSQENISADQEAVVKKPPDLDLSEEFVKKIYDEVGLSASEVASYVNDGNIDLEYKYEDATALYWASWAGFDETVHQLVSSADELEVVIPHELCGDLGSKQPSRAPGGNSPVLNLRQSHE